MSFLAVFLQQKFSWILLTPKTLFELNIYLYSTTCKNNELILFVFDGATEQSFPTGMLNSPNLTPARLL